MSKKQVMAEIIRHTSLSDGIFDMTLKAEEIAKEAKAGQFISVYLNNMKSIIGNMIKCTELVIFNRCSEEQDLPMFRRNLKAFNYNVQMMF